MAHRVRQHLERWGNLLIGPSLDFWVSGFGFEVFGFNEGLGCFSVIITVLALLASGFQLVYNSTKNPMPPGLTVGSVLGRIGKSFCFS